MVVVIFFSCHKIVRLFGFSFFFLRFTILKSIRHAQLNRTLKFYKTIEKEELGRLKDLGTKSKYVFDLFENRISFKKNINMMIVYHS